MPTIPTLRIAQGRLRQRIRSAQPLARAEEAFGLRHLAHGAEQKAQRGVRHFFGQHIGRVGDDDSVRARPPRVDVVVADAEAGDQFELREPLHQRRVDPVTGRDDNRADSVRNGHDERIALRRGGHVMDRRSGTEARDDERLAAADEQQIRVFSVVVPIQATAQIVPPASLQRTWLKSVQREGAKG